MTGRSSRLLTGWGRTSASRADAVEPGGEVGLDEAAAGLLGAAGPRGVLARGLGRSYGDAAQNGGGTVLLTPRCDRVLALDTDGATITVEAGASLDTIMRTVAPHGLWPVVSPGTRQVTVGGAIACDVHGKGHHRDGSFARHVRSMRVVTPASGPVDLVNDDDSAPFWATAGGMGLTGIITSARLSLTRIETTALVVDSWRTADLDSTMTLMSERDRDHRYSVAWIDCLGRGASLGRSVVDFGDHAALADLPAGAREGALRFEPRSPLPGPPWAPRRLLNRWTIAAFNEIWYRKAPRHREGRLVPAAAFFHPLDAVDGWNRLYGSDGFLQYQFVVPDGAEEVLRRIIETLAGARVASFLAVLKRFGPADPGPLSFPMPGWTLALDIPAAARRRSPASAGGGVPAAPPVGRRPPGGARSTGLGRMLDGFDELVAAAGGRVYLAKDSRLRPDLLEDMYPRLAEWREVRAQMDPDGVMRSDLSRRLDALCGPA